jgi:LysR family transcriptional regulator, hydrogen peroxide-inducible genes activator
MEIHQLRYFCEVVRQGTFTRASEVQKVAQPSLSQQILKLEAELGGQLFDRLPRSATLTVFGKAFLPRAERILREVQDAKAEILEMTGEEKGLVVLGVIPTIAPYLLPPILEGFAGLHPTVYIHVVEEITPILLDRLHQGSIDMAIIALPATGAEVLATELFEERFLAVLPENHPRAKQRSIRFAELKDDAFLLLKEGHCFRDNVIAACRESRTRPTVAFESGQFSTILAMVAAGMGVSAVPAMAAQPVQGCRFVPITGKRNFRKIGVIKLRHHFETRAQAALVSHIVEVTRGKIKH